MVDNVSAVSKYGNIFSVLTITQAKQIINLLLLNNFHPVMSYDIDQFEKGSDELLCTVLVTRYGPRSIASASGSSSNSSSVDQKRGI